MSVRSWFRALLAGPTTIAGRGVEAAEADAALGEDFGTRDAGEEDLQAIAGGETAVATVQQGASASEGAETALEDLESEEAPADRDP